MLASLEAPRPAAASPLAYAKIPLSLSWVPEEKGGSMEAVGMSLVIKALVAGAAAVAQDVAKDVYDGLKALIRAKYAKAKVKGAEGSLEALEGMPESDEKRKSVAQDLERAGQDPELDPKIVDKAQEVLGAVEREAPHVASAVGIDWEDVKADIVRLKDIRVHGSGGGTGIRVKGGKFGTFEAGNITVGGRSDPTEE